MNIGVDFKNRKEVEDDVLEWGYEIRKTYEPDLIIFIAKSGFIFGRVLADYFGCDLVDIVISRPSNRKMDLIKKIVPIAPRPMLAFYLRHKVTKKGYDECDERYITNNERMDAIDLNSYSKILIVDDSVDTGWSLKKAIELLSSEKYTGEYKVASYCVLDQALKRIDVDYFRYMNRIVITATSRYSKEYRDFISQYSTWKENWELLN